MAKTSPGKTFEPKADAARQIGGKPKSQLSRVRQFLAVE
jgi:hypothetical protein